MKLDLFFCAPSIDFQIIISTAKSERIERNFVQNETLLAKIRKTIWTVSTMSCLWKLIKFSVVMWDSKNGAKMSIKICCVAPLCTFTAE